MSPTKGLKPFLVALPFAILPSCSSDPAELPSHELSMRFAHPELYEGRDAFARPKALFEMLERKILRRGMTADEVQSLLGAPDRSHPEGDEETQDSCRIGEPFIWEYWRLKSVLRIEFDRDERATKFVWYHDEGPCRGDDTW